MAGGSEDEIEKYVGRLVTSIHDEILLKTFIKSLAKVSVLFYYLDK